METNMNYFFCVQTTQECNINLNIISKKNKDIKYSIPKQIIIDMLIRI
jgi:hypothetical protein